MTAPVFIDYSPQTPITAAFLNSLSNLAWNVMGGPSQTIATDLPTLQANLQIPPAVSIPFLSVKSPAYGAKGDGVTDDTVAINNCILAAVAMGGGTIYFPPGTYLVSNINPSSTSWDTNCGIWVLNNNINLLGAGKGATKIRLANNANAHVVCFGQRTNGTVAVQNCSIAHIEIDGNSANQNIGLVNATDYHNAGLMVQSGAVRVNADNLYVHNCVFYGIGYQRDGIYNCYIRNVYISQTGVDAIDWKNDSDNSYGNVIDNVIADNWGTLPVATTGDPSAAFDLRSGITATNLVVQTPGQSAVAGLRFQNGTPGTKPFQASKAAFYIMVGNGTSGSAGVRVISRDVTLNDGFATAWDDGHSFSEPDCRYDALQGYNNVTSGFRFWNNASAGTLASTNASRGLIARSNGVSGIICDGNISETDFIDCDVRSNTTYGYDLRVGTSNIRIIDGSATGNGASTAANINQNNTNPIIRDVSGYRTYQSASASVAIDSTGTKSFSIAHGMPFTPSTLDVQLTLRRNTNVGDWSDGFLWVTSCDSTNVNGQVRVLTASATSGAVVDVVATVNSNAR